MSLRGWSAYQDAVADLEVTRFHDLVTRFATGVAVITGARPGSGRRFAVGIDGLTWVSACPRLVCFVASQEWDQLREAAALCVNILGEGQRHVAAALESGGRLGWIPGERPALAGALAWLDCVPRVEYPAGDRVIVVAEVGELERGDPGGPLVRFAGDEGRFTSW